MSLAKVKRQAGLRAGALVGMALAALTACGPGLSSSTPGERVDVRLAGPASLEVATAREGERRSVKVRVWAAPEVTSQAGWRERLTDEIDYASQFLAQLVGIDLDVIAMQAWPRRGDIVGARVQLAQHDTGDGVAWVIGYVASDAKHSTALVALGDAELFTKHLIIRDWNADAEVGALAEKLTSIAPAQRDEVTAAHRRHKQAVVLVHHLFRSLGAIWETDPAWIMSPKYSPAISGISDRNRQLLQLAIDAQRSAQSPAATASALLASMEASPWGGWVERDHDDIVVRLRAQIDAERQGRGPTDVPPEIYDQFQQAKQLVAAGKLEAATAELDAMLAAYPAQSTLHLLRCEIALRSTPASEPVSAATVDTCRRVNALAGADHRPHLLLSAALAARSDRTASLRELAAAEQRLKEHRRPGAVWIELAEAYAAMGALGLAQRALALGENANHPLALQIASQRIRYGVKADSTGAADEGAAVAAVRAALDLVYKNQFGPAQAAIAAGRKRWPQVAGFDAAACDLELRRGRLAKARSLCERAIADFAEASWAHYLLGIISLRGPKVSEGIASLQKAIRHDPDLGQAWRALAKGLDRAGRTADLAQLKTEYKARFGLDLP